MEESQFQNQTQQETPLTEKKKSFSFSGKEALDVVRTGTSRPFRIHVFIGVFLSFISLVLWVLISFAKKTWPFFFYIFNFFVLTTSVHYYLFIRPKELLPLHIVWYGSINLMLVLTWFFTLNWYKAWFLYPLIAWGLFLCIHYLVSHYRGHPDLAIYIHTSAFIFLNALFFFIWMDCNCFPFFILVVFILGLPFSIHWCRHYSPGDRHKLHLYIYIDINLLLFFIWITTDEKGFPWFIFPLVVWGILLGIHFWKIPRVQASPPSVPVTDENPTQDYPTNNNNEYSQPPPPYTPSTVPLDEDKHNLYPVVDQNQQNQ